MPTAAETHDAMVAAYNEQRARVLGHRPDTDVWSGRTLERFRDDPRRTPEPVLARIASYIRPDDVVIDVGGGAGRLGLPLALRCRELINVDPSPGMRALFEEIAQASGITNARMVPAAWLEAEDVSGDVALVANVTYFVPAIALFLAKLQKAARRKVIVHTYTLPPPNTAARMFEIVNGEAQALVPNHEQLVPVLEEMGLRPEVLVLDEPRNERAGPMAVYPSREPAIESALIGPWLRHGDEDRVRGIIAANFDELFQPVEGGYMRRASEGARPVLITWAV